MLKLMESVLDVIGVIKNTPLQMQYDAPVFPSS